MVSLHPYPTAYVQLLTQRRAGLQRGVRTTEQILLFCQPRTESRGSDARFDVYFLKNIFIRTSVADPDSSNPYALGLRDPEIVVKTLIPIVL